MYAVSGVGAYQHALVRGCMSIDTVNSDVVLSSIATRTSLFDARDGGARPRDDGAVPRARILPSGALDLRRGTCTVAWVASA